MEVHAEDRLLMELALRLLAEFGGAFRPTMTKVWGGRSKINGKISGWNAGARYGVARLVMCDLDSVAPPDGAETCPRSETLRLLKNAERSPNFLLRFAVAESESWLLADGEALMKFLGVGGTLALSSADSVGDPKALLIARARKSRRRDVRDGVPPEEGSGGIGIAYNDILAEFVRKRWNPTRAAKRSKSLRRTLDRLAHVAGKSPPH